MAITSPALVVLLLVGLAAISGVRGATGRRMGSRVVNTKYGALRGLILPLANKNLQPVEAFLGVPYASPPTGPLRFMPPAGLTRWRGVRQADQLGPVCPQKLPDIANETAALRRMPRGRLATLQRLVPFLTNQSEDCLYLNIYAPARVGRETLLRLPVMVYIHGESYEWNAGNPYDGSVLASFGNVVVVTINFRLGLFGFLASEGESAPSNFGLWDQIAALHWIADDIEFFGGDPHNVTIFGQGHGAALVHILMMSPVAKGLFHRAIVQSGAAWTSWALAKDPLATTARLAAAVGCPASADHAAVECLRTKTAEELIKVSLPVPDYLTDLGPVVDGIVVPAEAAISPGSGGLGGRGPGGGGSGELCSKYDLLFGVTKFEAHVPMSAEDAHLGFEADKRDRLLRTFLANTYRYHLNELFALLVNEYTDWTKPVLHPIIIRDTTMELLGDALVVAPLLEAGNCHARQHPATFFYDFGYQSRDGDYPQRLGCAHGEELPYVFGAPLVDGLGPFHRNYTKAERMLSEAVMRYWTNFAKSGDPNQPEKQTSVHGGKNKNRFVKITWPHYDIAHQKYLSIGMRPKIRHHYRAHKLSIWTRLIPEIHASGGTDDAGSSHHLFTKHDDPATFEGIVRNGGGVPFDRGPVPPTPPANRHPAPTAPDDSRPPFEQRPRDTPSPPRSGGGDYHYSGAADGKNGSDPARVEAIAPGGYSTALGVTIAVGCSLLILNVLIFAGVYYQRDKNRLEAKLQKRGPPTRLVAAATVAKAPQQPLPPSSTNAGHPGHPDPSAPGGHPRHRHPPPATPPKPIVTLQPPDVTDPAGHRAPPPSPATAARMGEVTTAGGPEPAESQPLLAASGRGPALAPARAAKMQEIRV